jgi:tetratricopeptide (TPR) repeat protein
MRTSDRPAFLVPILLNIFSYGITLIGKGDYDAALATLEGAHTRQEGGRRARSLPRTLNSLGWLYSELGNLERAIDLNRQGAEEAWKRGNDPEMIANAELNLADVFLVQGDLALAQEFLDKVVLNFLRT